MKRPSKSLLAGMLLLSISLSVAAAWALYQWIHTPMAESGCLIWSGALDENPTWLDSDGQPFECEGWTECQTWMQLRSYHLKPGRYCLTKGETIRSFARKLAVGVKSEVEVVVPAHRQLGVIAQTMSRTLSLDSTEVHGVIARDTLTWRLLPNTYRLYWSTSEEELAQRLVQEHDAWWTSQRRAQARKIGMTPLEVVTLASIVQEEIAVQSEAKRVAGLYRNRLKKGMKLQADPTLKFALGDWNIRRILDADKAAESPYNTYLHAGLPPGPIRIPEPKVMEAVLYAEDHSFLFMCAKPDGSGRHAFATNYSAHKRNANAYRNWLNQRHIYR